MPAMDLPTVQMDEKQDVIRHEPTQRPDLGGEEVGATRTSMCVRMNSFHVVVFLRSGAGRCHGA